MKVNHLTFLLLFSFFSTSLLSQTNILVDSVSLKTQNTKSLSSNKLKTASVLLNGDTLFTVSHESSQVLATSRAKQISDRLAIITKGYKEGVDSIYQIRENGFISTMYDEEYAFITTERDAINNDLTLEELANIQMEDFVIKLRKNSKSHLTTKQWLIRIGYFILSLLGLFILFRLIRLFFKWINAHLSKVEGKFLQKKNNFLKYFIPKKTKNIFVFISNMVRLIITVFILIAYTPFMFSFFPWAEDLATSFYAATLTPIKFLFFGFINFLPDLIFIIVVIYIARYIVRILRYMAEDIEAEKLVIKKFSKDLAGTTQKIFSIIIYAFALVIVIPHLPGSASPAFQGVTIFLGALVSFGSTSAIANIVAGLVITYMRPYQIGDRVKIQNTVGDVIEKTLLITRIKTLKNEEVTIPNSNIITSHLINYSANTKNDGLILHTDVTIGYDISWEKVEKLLLEAAGKTLDIQKEPKPFVLQTSLDDNYVSYELNAYTKEAKKMPKIYSEIHRNILELFNDAGVEILSPSYIAARDGNLTTVPSQLDSNSRSPIEKIVDHLTGKNQKNIITKPSEGSESDSDS